MCVCTRVGARRMIFICGANEVRRRLRCGLRGRVIEGIEGPKGFGSVLEVCSGTTGITDGEISSIENHEYFAILSFILGFKLLS